MILRGVSNYLMSWPKEKSIWIFSPCYRRKYLFLIFFFIWRLHLEMILNVHESKIPLLFYSTGNNSKQKAKSKKETWKIQCYASGTVAKASAMFHNIINRRIIFSISKNWAVMRVFSYILYFRSINENVWDLRGRKKSSVCLLFGLLLYARRTVE